MTQRINSTPELKYSKETFREMYKALKEALAIIRNQGVGYCSSTQERIKQALKRAENEN